METKIYIIILLFLSLIFIYFKYYGSNLIEGLTSNEAVQNVASLYNSSLLTVSNLTIPSGGNITVASDSTNLNGVVNLGIINSSRNDGDIDITGSGKLNINTSSGIKAKTDITMDKTLTVAGDTTLNGKTTLKNTTLSGTFGPVAVRRKTGTVSGDDKYVTLTCDADETLMSCSCYSAWKECDGVKYSDDGKTCYIYAGSGGQITGSALCMKIGNGTQ